MKKYKSKDGWKRACKRLFGESMSFWYGNTEHGGEFCKLNDPSPEFPVVGEWHPKKKGWIEKG